MFFGKQIKTFNSHLIINLLLLLQHRWWHI